MIVATRTGDSLCRQAFGKDKVVISKIDKITELFKLDPTVGKPTKEAFIITTDDIRNTKIRTAFFEAAATKHPAVRIILISRGSKCDYEAGNGIDTVMIKPKVAELEEYLYKSIEKVSDKLQVMSSADSVAPPIEEYRPVMERETPIREVKEETVDVENSDTVEELEVTEELIPEQKPETVETNNRNSYADRINACNTITDVNLLTKELKATQIVKDLVKENATYANIEDNVRGLQEKIYSVMTDPSIPDLGTKLDRVKALLCDKEYFKAKGNTIIEQRVEEIIRLITSKTRELLDSRLKELDTAIVSVAGRYTPSTEFSRLAGIADTRANLVLELSALDAELRNIFLSIDNVAHETVEAFADASADFTGNPQLNAHLRLRGETIRSEKSIESILHVLSTAEKTSEEFNNALLDIKVMKKKMNELFKNDAEIIASQEQIIRYLREANVDNTVIANTLIKKSMRIFVGDSGSGRTFIPLMLSGVKSRSNANVLMIDLTGDSNLRAYGEEVYELHDYMENKYEKDLCFVEGKVTTPDQCQRVLNTLVRAADFYRVINVVVSREQRELFDILVPDSLSVTYIVDAMAKNTAEYKEFIKDTLYDNVSQKVIINKSTPSIARTCIFDLELDENFKITATDLPFMQGALECAYTGVKPYMVNSLVEEFKELSKRA